MDFLAEQVGPQTQNLIRILLDNELQLPNRAFRKLAAIMRKHRMPIRSDDETRQIKIMTSRW